MNDRTQSNAETPDALAPGSDAGVPAPAAPTPVGELPHPLTFFLTAAEREAVLAVLARHGDRRAAALLRALGIGTNDLR
ncbi:MAG: hypothetical protein Kow0022_11310 [Phycisphaerales bacterium]